MLLQSFQQIGPSILHLDPQKSLLADDKMDVLSGLRELHLQMHVMHLSEDAYFYSAYLGELCGQWQYVYFCSVVAHEPRGQKLLQ